MQWRRTTKRDFLQIVDLWERADYGFDMPDLASKEMFSSWVAVEDGKIVAWAGAQRVPEIIAIMDPTWGSPHWRRKLFLALHRPIAQDCRDNGYEKAFCNPDPKYCTFSRHLQKMGWWRGWESLWITAGRILGAKK
jgi:hypothetical protein